MFGKRKEKKTAVAVTEKPVPPKIIAPTPHHVIPEKDAALIMAYEQLATEINFEPGELIRERLLHFLQKNGYKIYDLHEVMAFLDMKFGKLKNEDPAHPGWEWIPLTKKDMGKVGSDVNGRRSSMYADKNDSGTISDGRTYQLAVPLEILQMVKEIKIAFPNIYSFVSGVALPKADPFLMITTPHIPCYVIAHWDEPEFGKIKGEQTT